MQCTNAQELFSDYIEAKIDRAMSVSLENHLHGCATCRNEVEQLRMLWGSLDELAQVEPPAFFHENIMSRVAQEQAKTEEAKARRRSFWDFGAVFRPRTIAFGAAALVLLLAGVEVVQTQRASLGPVGYVMSFVRPANKTTTTTSAIEVSQATWVPNAQATGGVLKLSLRPNPMVTLSAGSVSIRVMAGGTNELYHGVAQASQESEIEITLDKQPEGALSLTVQLEGGEATTAPFQMTPATP